MWCEAVAALRVSEVMKLSIQTQTHKHIQTLHFTSDYTLYHLVCDE